MKQTKTTRSRSTLSRRQFLVGTGTLVGAAALAGCVASEPAAPAESVPTVPTEETIIADTPRGPVTIPANPQRLVALYTHDLANALALGLSVIAGPGENGQPNAPFPPYLIEAFGDKLDNITPTVHRPELNFEQIAALQPDVILSGMFGNFDIGYETLEEIAPTVTYRYSKGEEFVLNPWEDVLRVNGEQFGREQEAEAFIARYEERAAELRERLAPEWEGASYAVIEPYGGQIWVYGSEGGHCARTLTQKLGFVLVDSVNALLDEVGAMQQGGAEMSYERLADLNADVLFIPVSAGADGTTDRSSVEQVSAEALWETLPAVQAGHVYEFTGDIWYESGPMAMAFLDVVERSLLG